jgi:putative hemolysin
LRIAIFAIVLPVYSVGAFVSNANENDEEKEISVMTNTVVEQDADEVHQQFCLERGYQGWRVELEDGETIVYCFE